MSGFYFKLTMKVLIKYKNYLLQFRGKLEPKLGDKITSFKNPNTTKVTGDLLKAASIIGNANYWEDYYVEIDFPNIEWRTANQDKSKKANRKNHRIIGYLNQTAFITINTKYNTPKLELHGGRFIHEGTLEECKQKAQELLFKTL